MSIKVYLKYLIMYLIGFSSKRFCQIIADNLLSSDKYNIILKSRFLTPSNKSPKYSRIILEILLFLVLFFIQTSTSFAQAKNNTYEQIISESKIYFDEISNIRYSNLIVIKFKKNIIELRNGKRDAALTDINSVEIRAHFLGILDKYGGFEIIKMIPSAVWGDTLVLNRRDRQIVTIPDWSQVFQLKFCELVPIDEIIRNLRQIKDVEYVEEAFSACLAIKPNDKRYLNGNNWALDIIEAERAWDITKGDPKITIAILDSFGDSIKGNLHEDLVGKVDYIPEIYRENSCNHGTCVSGVAGANTNNQLGIASLGWDLRLKFFDMTYNTKGILDAVKNKVDVINFSWVRRVDLRQTRDAVKTAIASGIVCVAAAGNDYFDVPSVLYPAAYNFGELGQVIAVSGTEWDGNRERFVDGWNYSPCSNPKSNPIGSFIDIAAPGREVEMLDENNFLGYKNGCGTSLSTPFVSALVGLMLSIDSTLTVNEVYNIITTTAEKVGQYSYDENGWNQYLGYGRINAYETLRKVNERLMVNIHEIPQIENRFSLSQNYPNPFNPNTRIKYCLPLGVKSEKANVKNVKLVVYDILGREVATLVDENQKVGNYEVEFDGSELTSGIYFYRLQAGDFIETKKMILIK